MKEKTANTASAASAVGQPKRLAFFERYLTVWVLLCMVVGVAFGKLLTLVLIFAFQAENLTKRWFAVLLIAAPILI